jgi:hypothetical protein
MALTQIFFQSELYNIVVGPLQTTDCTFHLLHLIPLSATCGRTPLNQSSVHPLQTVTIKYFQVIFSLFESPLWARASSLSKLQDHTQTPHIL